MIFPVQDTFWTETATFVRNTIGQDAPVIGPREFRAVLPKVFPYDWVHAIEILDQFDGVIIHKGLMQELPLPLLQTMKKKWKCVFANEVFLFFMPADSTLPSASIIHLQLFYTRLRSMEKQAASTKPSIKELTAFLVIASHAPPSLDKTLRSLSLFHMPVLVVAGTSDATQREAYRSVCSAHHAKLDESDKNTTLAKALKIGARRLLEDAAVTWISSFDDTMIVRPDFLSVMERFRNAETCPVLGGLWTEADGIRSSFSRDGFRLIIPRQQTSIHYYGHRKYWQQRLFPAYSPAAHAFLSWIGFPFIPRWTDTLMIGDLVALQPAA